MSFLKSSFLLQTVECEDSYNLYCLSKAACDLICSFPQELLTIVVTTPEFVNDIFTLVDDVHFSPQYFLNSLFYSLATLSVFIPF